MTSELGGDAEFAPLWSDPLSRRTMLRAAGIGIGALAVGTVLGACTANTATTGAGKNLTVAFANNFGGIDPPAAQDFGQIELVDLVFEKVYRTAPVAPRAVTPELATGMPQQVTPLTYRVPLRAGVTFHDGSPLTADDVVFTVKRVQDPSIASLYARFLAIIADVRAVSPTELEFTLSAPTTLLAERLALVGIMSRKATTGASDAALKLKPVGSGPYRVVSAASNERVTLARFAKYSGPRKVGFDNVTVNVVTNANARLTALRGGQAQVIEEVPPASYANLSNATGINAAAVRPGASFTTMLMHCGKPPFNDRRVRQAMLYAIDRDAITKAAFFSQATPAWAGYIPSDNPDYAKPSTVYRYDPDQARQLLAEAGYAGKQLPIKFLTLSDGYVEPQVPIITQNLQAVGFAPDVVPGSDDLYNQVSSGTYHVLLQTAGAFVISPSAEFVLRWTYYGDVAEKLLYWTDDAAKRTAALLDQAQSAPDDASRKQLLAQVQDIVQDEAACPILHFINGLSAWSTALRDYRPTPSGFVDFDDVHA